MTETEPHAPDTILIDARGLSCPLPVLRLNKRLRELPAGAQIILLATDRATLRDVPAYCQAHGHDLSQSQDDGALKFLIRKIA